MRKLQVLLGFFVCCLFASICNGQLIRGLISGVVTDPEGAVIPGVQITLTNTSTNVKRNAETNASGAYRFVAVDSGEYSIEFQLPGFETRKVTNVTVRTAQELVLDQALRVGAAETNVSVIETPGFDLNKKTPTVDRTFSERVVMELPIQIYNGARD